MGSLKRDEITGVTVNGEWIAKTDQTDMRPAEEGIIVREPTGERTLYPWAQVDSIKLVNRSL